MAQYNRRDTHHAATTFAVVFMVNALHNVAERAHTGNAGRTERMKFLYLEKPAGMLLL